MTENLPHRPRLLAGLPVLRRGDGEAQIGLDPRHAVVLSGLSHAVVDALRALDGRYTSAELVERAGPAERDAVRRLLLVRLGSAGLLEDAATTPAQHERISADTTNWALRCGQTPHRVADVRRETTVVVHGDGRLAVATGSLLAASGIGRVRVAATGTVRPADTGSGYTGTDVGRPRAAAATAALRRASGSADTAVPGHKDPPDLVILADTAVPDPDLVAGLFTTGVPHLLVRVREGIGWVGPLVLPGRTGCLRCLDLHRADRDACWPALAAQLAGRPQPADLACAQATSALAVAQVLGILHDRSSLLWNAAVLIDPCSARIWRREWSAHPGCACGAAEPVADVSHQSTGCGVDLAPARMTG